jgi:hypothetical protein
MRSIEPDGLKSVFRGLKWFRFEHIQAQLLQITIADKKKISKLLNHIQGLRFSNFHSTVTTGKNYDGSD